MFKVILAIVCCLVVTGFLLNEAAWRGYRARVSDQCTPQNPFVDLIPECGGMKPAPAQVSQAAPAAPAQVPAAAPAQQWWYTDTSGVRWGPFATGAVEAANRGRAAMGLPPLPVESEQSAPPQAERTDIYQQSLQLLLGETLTPLN